MVSDHGPRPGAPLPVGGFGAPGGGSARRSTRKWFAKSRMARAKFPCIRSARTSITGSPRPRRPTATSELRSGSTRATSSPVSRGRPRPRSRGRCEAKADRIDPASAPIEAVSAAAEAVAEDAEVPAVPAAGDPGAEAEGVPAGEAGRAAAEDQGATTMLMPKRVKYRKQHRGRRRGKAHSGNVVSFGEFGLQALESCWMTANQIKSARIAINRYVRRAGKIYKNSIFPDKPYTKKPAETRMGSGKGPRRAGSRSSSRAVSFSRWAA